MWDNWDSNMLPKSSSFSALLVIVFSCSFSLLRFCESVVPQDEIDTLQEITKTMGANYWKFNGDSCEIESVGVKEEPPEGAKSRIGCGECKNTVFHVTEIGYMAPEYALWGHPTYKADVYSFGVVALEIISGKNNNNYIPSDDWVCLLDWACHLQQTGNLLELIDEKLGYEVDQKQAEIMVKVALLCTNASASLRPSMSEPVSIVEGQIPVPDVVPEPRTYKEDLRFKAMRDLHRQRGDHSSSISHAQNSTTVHAFESTSTTGLDFSEINSESRPS